MSASTPAPILIATERTILGKKVSAVRRSGHTPAVLYGNGKGSRSLAVPTAETEKLIKESGTTTLISLQIGKEKPVKVLVHAIQKHPLKRNLEHLDLFEVNLKEKLRTQVPVVLTGVADAVATEGGTLLEIKGEVEVECLPENLPQHLELDITSLKTFEDSLRVSDIQAPQGVVILDDTEDVIVSVTAPRSEEELEELDETVDATVNIESETGNEVVEEEAETK